MNENLNIPLTDVAGNEVWSAGLPPAAAAVPPGVDPLGPVTTEFACRLAQAQRAAQDTELALAVQKRERAQAEEQIARKMEQIERLQKELECPLPLAALIVALVPALERFIDSRVASAIDAADMLVRLKGDLEDQVKEWVDEKIDASERSHLNTYDHDDYDNYARRLDDLEENGGGDLDEKINDAVNEALSEKDYVEKDDLEAAVDDRLEGAIDDWMDDNLGAKIESALAGSQMTVQIRRFE